ncbi:MAG: hypothetical protein NZ518_10230, partial [Dehalococcoidia bacterium]|nr:hypothetical protein [Dehalococcoidia bacterium]
LTGIQEGIEQLETSAGKLNVQKEDRWSRPLAQRLDAIVGQFQSLRRGGNAIDDQLAAELRLIEWYFEKGQVLHAGLLLREWLISVFLRRACPDAGAAIFSDGKLRETGEKRLNALANQLRSSPPPPATTPSEPVEPDRHVAAIEQTTSIPDSLRQLWDGTVEMRNDLAHFGHRKNPLPADSIRRQIHERLGIANALLAETQ